MRVWQIVGLAVGLLVASVVAVAGLTLFVLPDDTFDGPRAAIEGLETDDDGDDAAGDDVDTAPAD